MTSNLRFNNTMVKGGCILRILFAERKDQFYFCKKGVFLVQDSSWLSSHIFWVVWDDERGL